MSLVVATKVAFIGWGMGIRSFDFTGFSGHSMRATAVIPVLFYLILQKAQPIARASGVLLGILFGMVIGISRLVLHAHSISEVIAVCLLGGMVSLSFIWILGFSKEIVPYHPLIALALIALLALPYADPAAASCIAAENADPGSCQPRSAGTARICAVEEIGSSSVTP